MNEDDNAIIVKRRRENWYTLRLFSLSARSNFPRRDRLKTIAVIASAGGATPATFNLTHIVTVDGRAP
jgi:hypothetical protein